MKTLARQEIFQGRIIKVVKDDVELANGSKLQGKWYSTRSCGRQPLMKTMKS